MNLGQMDTAIRSLINETSAGFWTDIQIYAYINMANERVCSIVSNLRQDLFTTSATFVTVGGQQNYGLPADCKYIRRMEIYDPTNVNNITKLDEIKFPRIEAGGDWFFTQNDQPQRYILRAQQFALEPVPDTVYNIRLYYEQIQPQLVNTTDTPTLPTDWHDLIVFWAATLAKKQNQEDDAGMMQLFNLRKQEMIENLINRGSEDTNAVEAFLQGVI